MKAEDAWTWRTTIKRNTEKVMQQRNWIGIIFLALFQISSLQGFGEDWPQWRGPSRDGRSNETGLLKQWPSDGPKLAWHYQNAGSGFSSIVTVADRAYTLGTHKNFTVALCLNLDTGKLLWKTKLGRLGNSQDYDINWGAGPRSTPTISEGKVYALTDLGTIACLKAENGELIWKQNLVDDFGGVIPEWGYSGSPLIDEDRLVVTPGKTNYMVALNSGTGEKKWSSHNYDVAAQYASVMKGQIAGRTYYLSANKEGLVAFDRQSGKLLFSHDATSNTVAAASTPLIKDNLIYHSSGYGGGSVLLELSKNQENEIQITQRYHLTGRTMRNHHGGVVLADNAVFGFTEANRGTWIAQDLATGSVLWEERIRPNQSGSACFADGFLYCHLDKDRTVSLVQLSRMQWESKGILYLPKILKVAAGDKDEPAPKPSWTHPSIANGKLFIRDQENIYAYMIAADAYLQIRK